MASGTKQDASKLIHTGNYLTLVQFPNFLRLILNGCGKELLEDYSTKTTETFKRGSWVESETIDIYEWKIPHFTILSELFEDIRCNSEIELHSELAGCLTSSPLITFGTDRNDDGEIVNYSNLFWFPDYAIRSELEELLTAGYVDFDEQTPQAGQGFSELTLTNGTNEIMFHFQADGTISDIYTYKREPLDIYDEKTGKERTVSLGWKSHLNSAFVHCPESEIEETATLILSQSDFSFGEIEDRDDIDRVNAAINKYDIPADANLYFC